MFQNSAFPDLRRVTSICGFGHRIFYTSDLAGEVYLVVFQLAQLINLTACQVKYLELLVEALIFIFPAYSANAVPVVFGGGYALDFGKIFYDNRPVLGTHKTFRGFFTGLIVGTLIGIGESFVFPNYDPE